MEEDLRTIIHNVVKSFELVGRDVEVLKGKLSNTNKDLAKLEVNSSSVSNEVSVLKHELISIRNELEKLRQLEHHLLDNFKLLNNKLDNFRPKREVVVKEVIRTKIKRGKKYFIAGKTSGKLHLEDCVFGKKLKRNNKIVFASKAKAFKKGFKPCVCLKK